MPPKNPLSNMTCGISIRFASIKYQTLCWGFTHINVSKQIALIQSKMC